MKWLIRYFVTLSKSLCFFLSKPMFLRYSQSQGWLAGCFTFPTGRKRLCGWERLSALWLIWWQGGQRCEESWRSQCYQKDRALHSSLTAQQRENVWKRRKEECETGREKESVCELKEKKRNYVKEAAVAQNVMHKYQGERWNAARSE